MSHVYKRMRAKTHRDFGPFRMQGEMTTSRHGSRLFFVCLSGLSANHFKTRANHVVHGGQ